MKQYFLIFNFFWTILIFGCASPKVNTSPIELKEQKGNFAKADTFLPSLLNKYPEYFDTLLKQSDKFKLQIIYTQIDRLPNNKPVFTNHYYNIDPDRYYYPASTVKLPVAVLALQRLNELKIAGLDRNSTMITEAAFAKQTAVYNDPSTKEGKPTIANYIKKILLVSDNEAFNRLYEFLGQDYINDKLHKMGYDSAQIIHRLDVAMTEEQNRHTNPIKFHGPANEIIYQQPLLKSTLQYQTRYNFLGKGYMSNGSLKNEPFDFSKKNRLMLTDLHSIVQSLLFPETVTQSKRFNITKDDYYFLYKHMSMMPGESLYPEYDSAYTDAYAKFLLFGGDGKIENPSIRIFNKVGDAYGFLTDAAYIVDFEKGVEFMLSASIYCNSDEIFNDDQYDYDTVGFPFMKNLGQVIYDYELKREKTNKPDLSSLKFNYKN